MPPEVIRFLRSSMDPRNCYARYGKSIRGLSEYCPVDLTAELNSTACVTRTVLHMKTHRAGKDGLTGKALLGLKLTGAKKEGSAYGHCHPSELVTLIAVMLGVDDAQAPPRPTTGEATAEDVTAEEVSKAWQAWGAKVRVAVECAAQIEKHIKAIRSEDKIAKAAGLKERKLQAALKKSAAWDPAERSLAVHALAIEPVRKVVFGNILTLREFCVLRRVSSDWKTYVDSALTPRMKILLKNQDLEKTADQIRKLKPKQTQERDALVVSLVAEFGPQASATVDGDAWKVDRLDAAIRRNRPGAKGKNFCQLTSGMKIGAVAYRCEKVLPGAGLSKEAICSISENCKVHKQSAVACDFEVFFLTVVAGPSSSASTWRGARELGILRFQSGRTEKGGGWRAGGAWEGWLGSRIQPQSCDREACKACRAFRTLLLPRCTMVEEAEGSEPAAVAAPRPSVPHAHAAPRKQLAYGGSAGWKSQDAWLSSLESAERAPCAGCAGACDAWGKIAIMRDCLAGPAKLHAAPAAK